MSILLKINTVSRTDIIQDSINWDQQLTKDPSILSFSILNGGQSLPALGDVCTLTIGGTVIFNGTITQKSNEIENGLLEVVEYEAKDGFHTFDRRLVVKAYSSQTADAIVKDIIDTFTSGFTYVNVVSGAPLITTIRFNYEQPSQALKTIANAIGWDWYIDATNDVHFFPKLHNIAPFSITDDNGNLISNSLNFDRDILSLKNTIYVRGGEYSLAISSANAVDKYVADGTQNTFPLVYQYKNVVCTIDGGAPLNVGIDFIDDPATHDCLYNYQQKSMKWPDGSKPAVGKVIRVYGDAQVPLIVQAIDETSILAYGAFEYVIVDKSIESVLEAQLRALSTMDDFASASYEGEFQTLTDGLLTGQFISITSVARGVSDVFKITEVSGKPYDSTNFIYTVKFLKSGNITFMDLLTDLLAEKRKNIIIDDNEVLERMISISEALAIVDSITSVGHTSPPYVWDTMRWNFFTWS
jgi:hypothetical protein